MSKKYFFSLYSLLVTRYLAQDGPTLISYLVFLRVEITAFHSGLPTPYGEVKRIKDKVSIKCTIYFFLLPFTFFLPRRGRHCPALVSVALIRPPYDVAIYPPISITETGVTRYAALWSPDFPLVTKRDERSSSWSFNHQYNTKAQMNLLF